MTRRATSSSQIRVGIDGAPPKSIETAEALHVLYDPLRFRLMQALDRPMTVRELGESVGAEPNGLYYHLRLLQQHGFVRVATSRPVAKTSERLYERTAGRFVLPPELSGTRTVRTQQERSLAQSTEQIRTAWSGSRKKGDVRAHTALSGRLSNERARELTRRLDDLAREFFHDDGDCSAEDPVYALLAVVTPHR